MRKKVCYLFAMALLWSTFGVHPAGAQKTTSAWGVVTDSLTGEALPFVSVVFDNSTIGAMTDDNGSFQLENNRGLTTLVVTTLGYHPGRIMLRAGQRNENLHVALRPITFEISEIVVKPRRERYSRKDNPAVELIRNVIRNKERNNVETNAFYRVEMYEKLVLSLDDFRTDMEKNGFLRKFRFVKNHLDTSRLSGNPILPLSIRESISDRYYRKSPRSDKTVTRAKRQEGIDETLDDGGAITSNLEEIFRGVNIFDENINILLNRFVSPLSSALATSYYKYYIMDTLLLAGDRCVDLAFVPVNSQSYGFTGRLYITLDGRYSVRKVLLNVPKNINLNWVDELRIEQEFTQRPDSAWVLKDENTYIRFYVVKGAQQFYAHQLRSFDKYNFDVDPADPVFGLLGPVHTLPRATAQADTFWVSNRHIPLKEKEGALTELLAELRRVPVFNAMIKTIEILVSGYIATAGKETNGSLFDFGPMNTTFSANQLEGFRMRVGGMTTANLHPQWFASGYLAYGIDDRKYKYNTKLTYSFLPKSYHEDENPRNNLSFMHEYDVYTPGQDFLFTSKDNMFVAWKVGRTVNQMQYIRKSVLQYEKEWLNGLGIKTWLKAENNEAAGALRYDRYDSHGLLHYVKQFNTTEAGIQFRFAPGEKAYGGRAGRESVFNLAKDAPVFKLSHQLGIKNVLGGDFHYNHTEFSAEKRIWLSSFGHIDAQVKAGNVWGKTPFPLLILPNTNQSITIQPETFTLMRAMEFVADRYAAFHFTYYLKGWILNRIPLVRWFKLREVVSFNGFYGQLSDKNNPALHPQELYKFPATTRPMGDRPYLEASVGVENIFKLLRVDYYRRLTYLNEPGIQKSGIRIALRFSF